MKADDLARARQELAEVPWDDVREQRVLSRVMVERKRPARRRTPLALFAGPVVAAAAAAAAFVFLSGSPGQRNASTTPAPTSTTAPTATGEQSMALADGSRAIMLEEAGLQVEEQRADSVRLHQTRGRVRYEVKPNPERAFIVHAGDVNVRVRGTVFSVEVNSGATSVSVTQGKVEVEAGERHTFLGPGESIRVATTDLKPDASADESADLGQDPDAIRPAVHAPSVTDLLAKADAARLRGDFVEAAKALRTLVATYPKDSRVPSALFSLGRVERARGNESAAAKAFERCFERSPSGPLAEDALAESAVSWSAAGSTAAARAGAARYLERYPTGAQAARMKSIVR